MIVKDEEEVLSRCLDSASPLVDEIVIVDTGSSDKTTEIARTYTENLYNYRWNDDFSAARNFAFSKARGDYLFWLDADDVIPPESAEKFPSLKMILEHEAPDMVMCPYVVAFDGAGKPMSTFYRERFLRRESGFLWQGRIHECIVPRGKILRLGDLSVHHLGSHKEKGARNLDIFRRWAQEEPLGEREKFYYGRELYYHKLYTESIAMLEEMLRGNGWYVNKIEACKTLALCHEARGEFEAAALSLMKSFLYGAPRATVLCELGRLFRDKERFQEAAFFYEGALLCRDHSAEGDFEVPSCRALTPLLELVCCYFRLGDMENALRCHKKTEELAPEHPSVVFNRKFFASYKSESNSP